MSLGINNIIRVVRDLLSQRNLRKYGKFIWWKISPNSYRKWVQPVKQLYSIGIASGKSPFEIKNSKSLDKPVLTFKDVKDVPATFVADPFMIKVSEKWFMFFEVKNTLSNLGEIGLATSNDLIRWNYDKIVLKEKYHLSYPYVFQYKDDIYMLPETSRNNTLTLYVAKEFPYKWIRSLDIFKGQRFADSSIFEYNEKLWLFTDAGIDTKNPILRLYYADTLSGPWHEHPKSPIMENDPHKTRPCGRIIVNKSSIIRFAQDIYPIYGSKVFAFQITSLTPEDYEEEEVEYNPILEKGDSSWNDGGMHHIDAHQSKSGSWIACVDGFTNQERIIGTAFNRLRKI